MSDPFAQLVPDSRQFLSALATNNTRDWFAEHRSTYDTQLANPARLLLDQVSATLQRRSGTAVTGKLFRPQRDVRFSKDKTPYHLHLHLSWTLDTPVQTGLFFGIAPDYCTVGGGIMGFSSPQLAAWRPAVDGLHGDELAAELDSFALRGYLPWEAELKRVPAPYGRDHPHGALLRRKSLTLWHEMTPTEQASPLAAIYSAQATLTPLFRQLQIALAGA